jgi:hypothetical protein
MGLLANVSQPVLDRLSGLPLPVVVFTAIFTVLAFSIVVNVLAQLLFKNPNVPPVVFHWVPFLGSTISYGMDPITFYRGCRDKVRDAWQTSCSAC